MNPTKKEQILSVRDEISGIDASKPDESTHTKADSLLVRTIVLLSSGTQYRDECESIIRSYNSIPKWYA